MARPPAHLLPSHEYRHIDQTTWSPAQRAELQSMDDAFVSRWESKKTELVREPMWLPVLGSIVVLGMIGYVIYAEVKG